VKERTIHSLSRLFICLMAPLTILHKNCRVHKADSVSLDYFDDDNAGGIVARSLCLWRRARVICKIIKGAILYRLISEPKIKRGRKRAAAFSSARVFFIKDHYYYCYCPASHTLAATAAGQKNSEWTNESASNCFSRSLSRSFNRHGWPFDAKNICNDEL
jgi:hypothetical protein